MHEAHLDTGVIWDEARIVRVASGQKVHGSNSRFCQCWVHLLGGRLGGWVGVARHHNMLKDWGCSASPLSALSVTWSKTLISAWGMEQNLALDGEGGLDKAYKQGESLLEIRGLRDGRAWEETSSLHWQQDGLDWCLKPDSAHQQTARLGRGSTMLAFRLSLQLLGMATRMPLSTYGSGWAPPTWAVSISFSITTEEQL